jgi:hypothetical protein
MDKFSRGKVNIEYPPKQYNIANPKITKSKREVDNHKKKQINAPITLIAPNLRIIPLIPIFGLNFKQTTYEL